VRLEQLSVAAPTLATEAGAESDGTARWEATTMVLVRVAAGGVHGLGYTYAHAAAAKLAEDLLEPCVRGLDVVAVGAAHARMLIAVRNQGRAGIAAAAISAIDNALWDLKARLLGVPLAQLLGAFRTEVPAYASGGFTSSNLDALQRELAGYHERGFTRAKLKLGRGGDLERVRAAREAFPGELMVDANGAYDRKQALRLAEAFAEYDMRWFEEPVSSDDLEGLRMLRDRAEMTVAAGEYGYDTSYFRHMLAAQAVDVLQADATRCMGITGFLRADALCDAYGVPLSSHCAPALHAHAACGSARFLHLEYFRDHARMEERLFDGVPELRGGELHLHASRPGLGLSVRERELAAML
jgi:L-alanine-DL-glutamate epimerase-like enolase superfamily enzyme